MTYFDVRTYWHSNYKVWLYILTFMVILLLSHYLYNRQAYTKVAGKYQDVLALEQSVAELHQMFLDFALLTEQQGELIDQIEFNVKSAADYVEEANVDVYHAIESSKSIRKKQWYVFLSFILPILIVSEFVHSCCSFFNS